VPTLFSLTTLVSATPATPSTDHHASPPPVTTGVILVPEMETTNAPVASREPALLTDNAPALLDGS